MIDPARRADDPGRDARPPRWAGPVLAVTAFVILGALATTGAVTAVRSVQRLHRVTIDGPARVGDLYLGAAAADVAADVEGDVLIGAGAVRILGVTGGNVAAAGGRVEARGAVQGGVRALGASVAVYGRVAGDLLVAGGSVTIVEGASIGGDLIVAGGVVRLVEGAQVVGSVRGAAFALTIEGMVGGDVRVAVERLVVAPGAVVLGGMRYESRHPARVAEDAAIRGVVERRDPWRRLPAGRVLGWADGAPLRASAILVGGALLVLLFPRLTAGLADGTRGAPLPTVLVGAGAAVLTPVALLALAATLVALPVAAIGAVTYAAGAYLSHALVGLALGRALLRAATDDTRPGRQVLALAGGVALIAVVRVLPIPGWEPAVAATTAVCGLGAVAAGLLGAARRSSGRGAVAPGPRAVPATRATSLVAGAILGFATLAAAMLGLGALVVGGAAAVVRVSRVGSVALPASASWFVAAGMAGLAAAIGLAALGAWLLLRDG